MSKRLPTKMKSNFKMEETTVKLFRNQFLNKKDLPSRAQCQESVLRPDRCIITLTKVRVKMILKKGTSLLTALFN